MELAAAHGFDVKVVALPPGLDPADDPEGFAARLASAEPYLVHRVKAELERADDRESAFRAVKAILDGAPDSPERQDAWRYANDRLGMTLQLRAGSSTLRAAAPPPQRVLDAGAKLERNALAGVLAHPQLRPLLAQLTPEHFYDPLHRRVREHVVEGTAPDEETVGLVAELDARAEAEASTRRPRRSCSGGCASASCGASCSTPTSRARGSSSSRSRSCSSTSARCRSGCEDARSGRGYTVARPSDPR